ncbi:TOMM precursor leader peptide-binding protein [Streptomyces sp. NPDC127084]|uniref:TOMM precursor leader peptide-binding protein n=1 Tax=Streptomyces sp. NPDC127084 TaxID=3347133 RepID=UPI00364BDA04
MPAPIAWSSACDQLRRTVRAGLASGGWSHARVTARPLGIEDVMKDVVSPPDCPTSAPAAEAETVDVPLHLCADSVVIGPILSKRPCSWCLARRWQSLRSSVVRQALETRSTFKAVGQPATAGRFTADVVAAVALARLHQPASITGVDVVGLDGVTIRRLPLIADPDCPVCGLATLAPTTQVDAERTSGDSEKLRLRSPSAYPLNPLALANPVCGTVGARVIRELASPTVSRSGGSFTLRAGGHLHTTQWSGDTMCFADSDRLALLEALERRARAAPPSRARPALVAPLAELSRDALDPRMTGIYPPEAYVDVDYLQPFSATRPISWVSAYSLRDHCARLVPEAMVYPHGPAVGGRFVQACSSGCASGGTADEAVLYALLEVIERDAFLLAWYARAELPEIDPLQQVGLRARHSAARLEMLGYRVRFFDTRMTFAVPVVTAVAERMDAGYGRLCFGAGAHPEPEAALQAALSEIATAVPRLPRLTHRHRARLTAIAADFRKVSELNDHWLLYGLPEMARHAAFLLKNRDELRPLHALAPQRGVSSPYDGLPGIQRELKRLVDQATAQGFDVLTVDQTSGEQRDLGLFTYGVVVPGLLPLDFGLVRERARHMARTLSAPRAAGFTDHDLRPCDVNPAPHPFP